MSENTVETKHLKKTISGYLGKNKSDTEKTLYVGYYA